MDLTTWITAEPGRLSALARSLGVTRSAVSQWRYFGVPVRRMEAVHAFTEGAVSMNEMLAERLRLNRAEAEAA